MKKEITEGMGYYVYAFMQKMGLRASVLSVYAVLYSYTKAEAGLFYGSQAYLARAIGTSVRTVQRALRVLFDRGLIERVATEERFGIRCVKEEATAQKQEQKTASECREEPYTAAEIKQMVNDGKLDDGELNGFYYDENDPSSFFDAETAAPVKYPVFDFGKHGIVSMTAEQYKDLRKLVKGDMLHRYIQRLEQMLLNNDGYGGSPPHSDYRTLKKWIKADLGVS